MKSGSCPSSASPGGHSTKKSSSGVVSGASSPLPLASDVVRMRQPMLRRSSHFRMLHNGYALVPTLGSNLRFPDDGTVFGGEACKIDRNSNFLLAMKNAHLQQGHLQPPTDRAHCSATMQVPFQDSGCSHKRTHQVHDGVTNRHRNDMFTDP